jgi:hypothetical protein
MLAMNRSSLAIATNPSGVGGVGDFARYRSRIILNNLFVLLLESIPYVDAGPWQTLKVWRVYVHQQKEFRRVQPIVLRAEFLAQRIAIMERFYLEYLEFAFQRSAARELGVRRAAQPARPLPERTSTTPATTARRATPQTSASPSMRDVAFAT